MFTQVGQCSYFDRVRRQFTRSNMDLRGIQSAWDLEDIVNFGQQMKVSYFSPHEKTLLTCVFCAVFYVVS